MDNLTSLFIPDIRLIIIEYTCDCVWKNQKGCHVCARFLLGFDKFDESIANWPNDIIVSRNIYGRHRCGMYSDIVFTNDLPVKEVRDQQWRETFLSLYILFSRTLLGNHTTLTKNSTIEIYLRAMGGEKRNCSFQTFHTRVIQQEYKGLRDT